MEGALLFCEFDLGRGGVFGGVLLVTATPIHDGRAFALFSDDTSLSSECCVCLLCSADVARKASISFSLDLLRSDWL